MQKAAEEVEERLKNGDELSPAFMANLEAELSAVLMEFRPLCSVGDIAQNSEVLDLSQQNELVEVLLPLLKKGDPECLQYVDKLRAVSGSGELIHKMQKFDFKTALEMLENCTREGGAK